MKKILFLGCNTNQIPYLHIIKEQGYYVVGADLNPNAPGKPLCNTFYPVAYDNIAGLEDIIQNESFAHSDRIFSAAAQFAQVSAAHLAENLKIDYPSKALIETCLDKRAYYDLFKQHNLPIPKTVSVGNPEELKAALGNNQDAQSFYVKSDYSKNPHYVYKLSPGDSIDHVNWQQDRYFRECYLVQPEFIGRHIRINLAKNFCSYFPFMEKDSFEACFESIQNSSAVTDLRKFLNAVRLSGWMVKFDVVINETGEYVVLDIGFDPPSRMVKQYKDKDLNFPKYYVQQYLDKRVEYPELENVIYE